MYGILLAFFTSFIATLLIIRTQKLHERYSADHDLSGPQKFHKLSAPRIGGVGVGLGVFSATLLRWTGEEGQNLELVFIGCALLPFGIGLAEDITKTIGAKARLFFIAFGSLVATYLLNMQVMSLDIYGIDNLLSISIVAILFTTFAITGLANAYNIIDGFNGLASMVGIITLLALGYVAFKVGDFPLLYLSITMAAALTGFFIWNYPRGLIFLGDGGAYLSGFWIALISVLMVARHKEISPWFALMVNGYPIMETLFTIYRRIIHQGKSPGNPDGIHFHSLLYRRVLSTKSLSTKNSPYLLNARTAPYLWLITTISVVPAILFRDSTPLLMAAAFLFSLIYIWIYKRIVRFRTPKFMSDFGTIDN